MQDKENFDDSVFKQNLYQSFKKTGVLDGLKAQMRSKLVEQLRAKQAKPDTLAQRLKERDNNLQLKLLCSLVVDFLKKNDLSYSMSTFVPECGFGSNLLSKPEMQEVLQIPRGKEKQHTALLTDIMDSIRTNSGNLVKPGCVDAGAQTDEGLEGLSVDQKLRRIELNFKEKIETERMMPYKTLEERMVKYKRECDERAHQEVLAEVARVKEIEMVHVRLEEAAKYRAKVNEFRNEFDVIHEQKVRELKIREQETLERWKAKEREIEAAGFEHRQKVIQDLEMLRIKEQEMKKTVELELQVVKVERENLLSKEKEAEIKLAENEKLRALLEKRCEDEINLFKREYEKLHEHEKRDLQRRKLRLEEDEQRIHMNKERIIASEKEQVALEKSHAQLQDEIQKLRQERDYEAREGREAKDEARMLRENAKRDHELI